ncbi:MAG: hypothetical protein FJX25_10640 [Alphaproteobacteria bacterium]|nr:hypothetical protein [Alphaproteobacteria bacterium]
MQVIKPVGREAAVKKYDILSALMAHGLAGEPGLQRLVFRLMSLITTRYNWQRNELVTGQREIARLWCVDERTVKRDMARLRGLGWIVVKRQGARGRVSVLRLDLDRILMDTRPSWPNIGDDYVLRMSQSTGSSTEGGNVVPFRRLEAAADEGDLDLWGRVRAQLLAEDASVFDAWFKALVEVGHGEGVLHLTAPSRFHANYLRMHLLGRLQAALTRIEPSMNGIRIDAP